MNYIFPEAFSKTLIKVSFLAFMVGLYSLLAIWKEQGSWANYADLPSENFAAFSLVLGLLLVFRTNTAYARWWEARTLWGQLVNATRNLAIKIEEMVKVSDADKLRTRQLQVAFPYALMAHLRGQEELPELPGMQEIDGAVTHIPQHLVQRLYRFYHLWRTKNLIDGDIYRMLDLETAQYLNICGGCERILKTRIARSYRIFARQCVVLFLFILPWGIVHEFGWWTFPLTMITAYFMIGLETVAEHVEEPFGLDDDDLDLEVMCKTMHKSVVEIGGKLDEN